MSDLKHALDETALRDYDLLRLDAGLVERADVAMIELTGDDRLDWLQGQVTQDLRGLPVGAGRSFCMTKTTGQILARGEVWAEPDRLLIAIDRASEAGFLRRVDEMVVIEEVAARSLTDVGASFDAIGPKVKERLGSQKHPEWHYFPSLGADGEVRVWIPTGSAEAIAALQDALPTVSREASAILNLERGLPQIGIDFDERTLPPELGPAFVSRHVSYQKGCYVGQEVLVRIFSRGHTNREWVGLVSREPVDVGAAVTDPRSGRGGVVTRTAFSPELGPIAAAMLRAEAAIEGTRVFVDSADGPVEAEVRPMPLLRTT